MYLIERMRADKKLKKHTYDSNFTKAWPKALAAQKLFYKPHATESERLNCGVNDFR